ncbi:hypothetical protein CB1_001033009 [Camelus ferus]|nr:hypothetical protein CB1_001033009 [Camelus ferus]
MPPGARFTPQHVLPSQQHLFTIVIRYIKYAKWVQTDVRYGPSCEKLRVKYAECKSLERIQPLCEERQKKRKRGPAGGDKEVSSHRAGFHSNAWLERWRKWKDCIYSEKNLEEQLSFT